MKLPTSLIPSTPSYDLSKHLAHVQKLYESYPYRTYEEGRAAMAGIMTQICGKRFPAQIADELSEAVYTLLRENQVFFLDAPDDTDPAYLQRLQHVFTTPSWPKDAIQAVVVLFQDLFRRLPQTVFEEQAGTIRVPLYDLIENVPDLIMHLSAHSNARRNDVPLLRSLNKWLEWNCIEASGYTLDEYSGKPLTFAFESKLQGPELIRTYLGHTVFEKLLTMPVPFVIPRKTWASHAIILAPPNHGKTQLLGSLIAGFLRDGKDPVGCFVLDPHGDLFQSLQERISPSRLVTLDPDTSPPPLNFLDFGSSTEAQTLQTFSYLMSSLSGGLSDKQGAIVPYLLKLLRKIPEASLETLRLVVDEKVKGPSASQFSQYIALLPQIDQGFFHNQYYSSRMQETKDAIGWKLYSALSSDAFRQMFSAKENSINFDAAIAERKVVIVKGARTSLGDDGMRVFLQFILAQYFAAGLRRERLPPEQRHLCMMFADECQMLMGSPVLANILVELRKYGCGWCGATQTWYQVGDEVKSAVLGATAIRAVGPVSHNDAVVLSREMHSTPDFIRSMRAREREGAEWAMYVSNVTPRAIRVAVPYGVLEQMPLVAGIGLAPTPAGYEPTEVTTPPTRTPNIPQPPPPTREEVEKRLAEFVIDAVKAQTQTAPVVPGAASDVLPASGSEANASKPTPDENDDKPERWH